MRNVHEWRQSYRSLNPRFNLPTKLTILRIGLCPIFFILFMVENLISHYFASFFFIVAAISDAYDGYLARKDGQVTKFGKIIDPIADKLLVTVAFVGFYFKGLIPSVWIIILILFREYFITFIRIAGVFKGIVIAADKWGKLKTTLQLTYIITLLIFLNFFETMAYYWFPVPDFWKSLMMLLVNIILYMALIVTLGSGINYLIKNKTLLKDMF